MELEESGVENRLNDHEWSAVYYLAQSTISLMSLFVNLDSALTEGFCPKVLKQKGVSLLPEKRFGLPGFARLKYCTNEAAFKRVAFDV